MLYDDLNFIELCELLYIRQMISEIRLNCGRYKELV